MGNDKWSLFDFCETLVTFQTADAYVHYIRRKTGNRRMILLDGLHRLLKTFRVVNLAERITGNKRSINKRLVLYQLNGFSKQVLERYAKEYYQECIKPNLISKIHQMLLSRKRDGWKVMLVSGGYDLYLKYYVEEFKLDGVLSTSIGFDRKGKCTGQFNGNDCLNEEKVVRLNRMFPEGIGYSESYSDSITDLPLLKWTDKGFVVLRKACQTWAKRYNLEEIIWD